jgi:peptidoglycan hydrolase-like protein with peptidoglycan-binding domain
MPATLRKGDTGHDVELLQRCLHDLGYYHGRIDRDFGDITEAALQQYQEDAGLLGVENGVCGDATWHSIQGQFGDLEGLRTDDSTERYVGTAYGIWHSSYATAEDRLSAMETACNAELANVGVPWVKFEFDPGMSKGDAVFHHAAWTAGVSRDWFEPAVAETLAEDQIREIVDTCYHESRHGEQWFNVLRLLAGLHDLKDDNTYLGDDGARHVLGVDPTAVAAAIAWPLQECTRTNGPAFEWYESILGSGHDNRNDVLGSISDDDPDNDRHDEYRTGLPEEADSWDTGGNVQREYRNYSNGGNAHDRPQLKKGIYNSREVEYLQQLLQWRNYYVGYQLDGDFGPHTEDAVKQVQAHNGIDDDGICGTDTWEVLLP